MRALVHIGLAMALVVAPTFCCCKVRGLGAVAHAAPAPQPASPLPVESCGMKAKASCCHIPKAPPAPTEQPDSSPAKPAGSNSCACCGERPDAAQTESKPTVAAAEPTGELLAVAAVAGFPEHAARSCGTHPTGRAGVDARSAALFERHVLRC
jgi:hypothetical protein